MFRVEGLEYDRMVPLPLRKDFVWMSQAVSSGLKLLYISIKLLKHRFGSYLIKMIQAPMSQPRQIMESLLFLLIQSNSLLLITIHHIPIIFYHHIQSEQLYCVYMTQLYTRISHIKQYITQLHQHLNANDHQNATSIINKFKKAVMKNDPAQHANQFLLDCLKTKHEKMLAQLQQMREQKKNMEQIITQKKNKNKNMKEVTVHIFISRLTVSLNQIKKVQYDEVKVNCDYQKITIDSIVGAKYKGYLLNVQGITKVEIKQNYAYLQYMETQRLNILIRFSSEKQMTKWTTCIKFGIMIEVSKKRDKLFQPKRQESKPESPSQHKYSVNLTPPSVPLLTFKPISPSQNVSIIEEKKQKSMDKMEKNTQRSLVNALSAQRNERIKKFSNDMDNRSNRDSSFGGREHSQIGFNTRQQHIPKYEKSRPNNLRIRGLSQNIDNLSEFNASKAYKATDKTRKASEDNWKPIMNKLYHDQMLKQLKEKEVFDDDNSSSISKRRGHGQREQEKKNMKTVTESSQLSVASKNSKYKSLEQKKMELLKGSSYNTPKIDVPKFNILGQGEIKWGIQQLDESKTSRNHTLEMRSKKTSVISGSNGSGTSNDRMRDTNNLSQHITQKSEEDSPVLPKHKNFGLDLPRQISYKDGTMLRLLPVEPNKNKALESEKMLYHEEQKADRSEEYSEQESSESESHAHSEIESNQNDTETEDNAVRAQDLKKGITLTKCAEKGWWPHEKIVYLSQTENQLCMRDIGDKKIKKIKINSITSVEYRKWDQGIIRHIPKIEEEKCLVIRAEMQDKVIKNFEFYGNNSEGLKLFADNLTLFLEYNRRDR